MDTVKYYQAVVEFQIPNENTGKLRKEKSYYLVDSMSCTETEAKIVEYLKGTIYEFKVVEVKETKIEDVV